MQEFQMIQVESNDGGKPDDAEEDNWEDLEYAEETMKFGRTRPL